MKWMYRFFTFVILAAALVAPFFMENKDGNPMLSLPGKADLVPDTLNSELPASVNPAIKKVYKWKDAQGVWHYGDTPPPGTAQVETLEVNTNANLIQGMPVDKQEATPPETPVPAPSYTPPSDENMLSMERAMNILNETKAVRDMMESRNQHLNAIVGENENQR